MLNNLHLTLMIGPAAPLPVSQDIINALTSVQVTNTVEGPSVFRLEFTLSNRSPLHTIFVLSGQASIPLVRVVILVSYQGVTERLIDGVVTRQDVAPGSQQGFSTLTITGEDLTKVMDYIPFDGTPFPGMPDFARVNLLLLKYLGFGIVPMVIPSVMLDVPIPTDIIPRQQGTDLQYIRRLADQVGYTFFIDYPSATISRAYWGPHIKLGIVQPALNTNMDAYTNVESIGFNFDAENKVLPIVMIQQRTSRVPIPIPIPTDITPLNPPLGLVPPLPKRILKIRGTAHLSTLAAAGIGLAYAAKSADGVKATGSLNVARYGHVLKARSLVGVRGAGLAFDGLYYVAKVTHKLKRGEYKQDFELVRNGLISTLPEVPV
jgi:hypothetical protein